jgi:hypothetical protein
MRQEVDVLIFFNISPKRAILGKIKVLPFSCLLLGFTCLYFLLTVSKMWLANLLTTISTKKNERFNLYMFNVIYMWHVPCVVSTLNRIFSVWLNLMLLPPYLAQQQSSILWKLVLEDIPFDVVLITKRLQIFIFYFSNGILRAFVGV